MPEFVVLAYLDFAKSGVFIQPRPEAVTHSTLSMSGRRRPNTGGGRKRLQLEHGGPVSCSGRFASSTRTLGLSLGSMMPLAHQSYGALLTIATSFAPIIKSQKQIPISPMLAGKLAKVEIPVSL